MTQGDLDAARRTAERADDAAATGPSGRATGLDLSQRLLDLVRRKAADEALNSIELFGGDMTASGHADGAFDAVVGVFSLFFAPDIEALAAELWRMAGLCGTLVIPTFRRTYSRRHRRRGPTSVETGGPVDRCSQLQAAMDRRAIGTDGGGGPLGRARGESS